MHAINRITDNVWFRFAHQILTIAGPLVLSIGLYLYQHTMKQLDDNTAAVIELKYTVLAKDASYDQQFINHENRLTRLENRFDGYKKGISF